MNVRQNKRGRYKFQTLPAPSREPFPKFFNYFYHNSFENKCLLLRNVSICHVKNPVKRFVCDGDHADSLHECAESGVVFQLAEAGHVAEVDRFRADEDQVGVRLGVGKGFGEHVGQAVGWCHAQDGEAVKDLVEQGRV